MATQSGFANAHSSCARTRIQKTSASTPPTPCCTNWSLRYPDKRFATESDHELSIVVDPVRARFSSWYEFFPRSTAQQAGKHGTFADCEKRLPYIAEMGFNVVYLPPIHPIGTPSARAATTTPRHKPGDFGSPWAIGSEDGGHKAIHPRAGHVEDFTRFVAKAKKLDLVRRARYRIPGGARSSLRARA